MSTTEHAPRTDQRYDDMTREELYDLAQDRDLEHRSQMTKEELVEALRLDDRGPDAVELLRQQHDAIRDQFDQFEQLSPRPSQKKQDLVRDIITHLVKHAEIEEQAFYPAVRETLERADATVDDSLEEHHVAEVLLAELDHLTPEADRFDAKVRVLIEDVREHMAKEEAEVFPAVVEAMPEERRREIGAAMVQLWEVAPTRPHPLSPDTPPANFLFGLPATAWDLTVGTARGVWKLIRRR